MFIHNVSEWRYSVKHVKSRLQDEIYCTQVINEVEKMFVHNFSENMNTYSAVTILACVTRKMLGKEVLGHLDDVEQYYRWW